MLFFEEIMQMIVYIEADRIDLFIFQYLLIVCICISETMFFLQLFQNGFASFCSTDHRKFNIQFMNKLKQRVDDQAGSGNTDILFVHYYNFAASDSEMCAVKIYEIDITGFTCCEFPLLNCESFRISKYRRSQMRICVHQFFPCSAGQKHQIVISGFDIFEVFYTRIIICTPAVMFGNDFFQTVFKVLQKGLFSVRHSVLYEFFIKYKQVICDEMTRATLSLKPLFHDRLNLIGDVDIGR